MDQGMTATEQTQVENYKWTWREYRNGKKCKHCDYVCRGFKDWANHSLEQHPEEHALWKKWCGIRR